MQMIVVTSFRFSGVIVGLLGFVVMIHILQ
jgi:hypothetical protein